MTNAEFAEKDENFKEACRSFGYKRNGELVQPFSKRQASKYRLRMGRAYKALHEPDRLSRRPK